MDTQLKEIIVAYFNGGCATGSNNKKSSNEINEDLKIIRIFCQKSDTEQE